MRNIKTIDSNCTTLTGAKYYISFSLTYIPLFLMLTYLILSFLKGPFVVIVLILCYITSYYITNKAFNAFTERQKPTLRYDEKNKKLHFARGFQTVVINSKTPHVYFETKRKPQKHIQLTYNWTETEGRFSNTTVSHFLKVEIDIEEAETINEIYKSWYSENWLYFERALKYSKYKEMENEQ